jgi:membrane fusion protein, hemolysin D
MKKKKKNNTQEILEYQPDAVEIEERPVSGKVRWVLYLILGSLIAVVVGAIVFQVDRIVVAEGKLITTSPMIVVQSLNTAVIRSIEVQVGDVVEKGQLLATLDSTFTSADLSQLSKQQLTLASQIRRIGAELTGKSFSALPEEGEDGRLQEHLFRQRRIILDRTRQTSEDKIAALESKRSLNKVRCQGKANQLKLLRDVEGRTARLPQNNSEYHLRLLEAQKARYLTVDEIENLKAEEQVTINELKQVESEWQRFVEERTGELIEQEVQIRNELETVIEEINKAKRLHELVSLRAPGQGIVLNMAERSVGSILQQAEPFITMVPLESVIEVEVNVKSKDIARIRIADPVRIKLDAFPFQRHDTLPGEVRMISEDSFQQGMAQENPNMLPSQEDGTAFYRTRIRLMATELRDVPQGFRLMPGMKVRAEIKIGTRKIISYFLYPIIRALDESLREP